MQEKINIFSNFNIIRILNLLNIRMMCSCELEIILDLSQSNISKSITKLKNNGIVNFEKESLWTEISLDTTFLKENEWFKLFLEENSNDKILEDDIKRLNFYDKNNYNDDFDIGKTAYVKKKFETEYNNK